LEAHGLSKSLLSIDRGAIVSIIRNYAREAGVRNLERELANVCRKVAVEVASGTSKEGVRKVKADDLPTYLGPPRQYVEAAERVSTPGVSVGLAWTPTGGDILFIEALRMKGRGNLTLTGHLGEVMQESARTALSLLRSRSEELGIDMDSLAKEDLHIHVPEGAIPKDGPSAGVAMTAALYSAFTGKPVRPDTAMTGEITLRGKVLPVGGIKEKVLAARRAGIKRVVLPDWNRNDVGEIPEVHRKGLTFHFAKTVDDVLALVFEEGSKAAPPGKKKGPKARMVGAVKGASGVKSKKSATARSRSAGG
jgi:ATP-dependent Lon protease